MKDPATGRLVPARGGELKPRTRTGGRNRVYWVQVWAREKFAGKLLACEMADSKLDEFKLWRAEISKQGTGSPRYHGPDGVKTAPNEQTVEDMEVYDPEHPRNYGPFAQAANINRALTLIESGWGGNG